MVDVLLWIVFGAVIGFLMKLITWPNEPLLSLIVFGVIVGVIFGSIGYLIGFELRSAATFITVVGGAIVGTLLYRIFLSPHPRK
ncbi:hypothetical protein C4552_03840 [Candidatus Parcubacteria bacterium]|nr:MAG: hypothetical protein C4552_03840 [Candidatus Parcubacteria bacterium]